MNRSFRRNAVLGSLLALAVFAAPARAELITFEFTGAVTRVDAWAPEYQGLLQVGDPFRGFYIFDSGTQDTDSLPVRGIFTTVLSTTAIGVTIGDLQFEGLATDILTGTGIYAIGDWIPGIELTSDPSLAQRLNRNHFSLEVRKDNLLADPNTLPLQPPSLIGADVASLRMSLDNSLNFAPFPYVSVFATLDTFRVVPEPLSALLLLAAVGSTCFVRGGRGKPIV